MSPPLGERKRAMKPKSRTGCVTCKSRRVKCDEGKPACARCIKFRIICEGYQDPYVLVEEKKEGRHKFRLMPRVHHNQALPNPFSTIAAFSSPFHDPGKNRYFLCFQEQTVSQLSGPFDEGLFSQVMLQACHSEPAIMCLIAAIGAIDISSRPRSNNLSASEASMHRHQALLNYGQALKGIQKLVSTPTAHTPRIILLASILIFCFENLHGDVAVARGHMRSALQLLHKQFFRKRPTYQHASKTSITSDLEHSIIATFVRLDNGLMSRPELILDAISTTENPHPDIITAILKLNYEPGKIPPSEFESIHEARAYLESLQFHSLSLLMTEFRERVTSTARSVSCQITTIFEATIRDFQRWDEAFKPLYDKSILPTATGLPNPKRMGAEIVRARAMSTVIAIQSLFPTQSLNLGLFSCTSPIDLTNNCLESLALSRRITAEPGFRKDFVLDCGIVPVIFMVMIAPVDASINREALEIMRGMVPRREGTWDSAALARVGELFLGGL